LTQKTVIAFSFAVTLTFDFLQDVTLLSQLLLLSKVMSPENREFL